MITVIIDTTRGDGVCVCEEIDPELSVLVTKYIRKNRNRTFQFFGNGGLG